MTTPYGQLYVEHMGQGLPPIVLDAGADNASDSWTPIRPALIAQSQVVRYDRPGVGQSPCQSQHCTSYHSVTLIRTLLHALSLPPPYVLVGHSFGGANMQLYARLYPVEVAGLILVDSMHPSQLQRFAAFSSEAAAHLQTLIDQSTEQLDWECSARQLLEAPPPSRIPCIVLSRSRETATTPVWNQLQTELAQHYQALKHDVVPESGHLIHHDQPYAVIAAIKDMLQYVRHNAR